MRRGVRLRVEHLVYLLTNTYFARRSFTASVRSLERRRSEGRVPILYGFIIIPSFNRITPDSFCIACACYSSPSQRVVHIKSFLH